jgi:hypothetical protein
MIPLEPTTEPAGDHQVVPDWEPGPPSLRAMLPSMVGGGVVPLAVYFVVRRHVHGDAPALMIAGAFPATWVLVEWLRRRTLDPIGLIVLFGFVVGVIASVSLGGNAFVLKVRDSAFTVLFGLACLLSLRWRRPAMFFIGRALSAGDQPERVASYNALYEFDEGPRTFRIITTAWGIGLICEACLRVMLAVMLSTGLFLAASPVLFAIVAGGLFLFTARFSRAALRRGQNQGFELPLVTASKDRPPGAPSPPG